MVISINGKIGCGKDTVGKIIQYLTCGADKANILYNEWDGNTVWNKGNHDWEIQKFAEELKQTICRWIGCDREQLEDQEFKNKELGEEWWYYKPKDPNLKKGYINQHQYDLLYSNQKTWYELVKLTPRLLLQLLGTEAGRDIIHPDIWVNILFSKYKPYTSLNPDVNRLQGKYIDENTPPISSPIYPKWIITDLRFPNEFKRIKKENGITIRIERPIEQRFPQAWKDFEIASNNDHPKTEENFIEFLKISNWEAYRKLAKSITHYSETALDNCDEFDYIINNNGTLEELIQKIKEILIKEKIKNQK